MRRVGLSTVIALALLVCGAQAAVPVEDLRQEVEKLRTDIAQKEKAATSVANLDAIAGSKYGPNAPVTTKNGKLQIGGLVQVWYQHIQNDHVGIVTVGNANALDNTPGAFPPPEPNEVLDNDTFRVRRTELRFTMDIHENVTAFVMIDPTRESNIMFTPVPTFPAHNAIFGNPNLRTGSGLQAGNTIIPQLLQDAYLNFHGIVPHHDFTLGQFKPPTGEEAWRSSGHLDFVERAMCTGITNVRDIGAMVHGTWVDSRVQYWFGLFNGPDGTVLTDPEIMEGGNRSDDNDAKDFAWRVAVRPVWNPECWWGRLEVGYARTDGIRGESGQGFDPDTPVNGLNRAHTDINRQSAWAWYRPGSKVKGWWLRGEWDSGRDRYSVRNRTNLLYIGGAADPFSGDTIGQLNPVPVTAQGWYFATGYKLSDSIWAESLKSGSRCQRFLHDIEFAFRYETYQNIAAEDLVNPDRHTDQFKTQAYTAGINYYLKGHDVKLQANYIWVDEPEERDQRGLREVKNNTFIVNFQVMF
jgi:phosphate-selective porin